MSYGIVISLAAAAIGISCIATDASAKGGGGGGGGGRSSGSTGKIYGPGGVGQFSGGAPGPGGGGTVGGARNYAPASYYGNATACGRYPYPPCKKVPAR
jgi:hypothetical protein